MRQRRFTALSTLSLILWAMLTAVWVRGHWYADAVSWSTPVARLAFNNSRGKLQLGAFWPPASDRSARTVWRRTQPAIVPPDYTRFRGGGLVDRRFAGFTLQSGELLTRFWALTLPAWAVSLLLALLPARWALCYPRWRRQSRREECRCARCGYDLRASSGRCPECGEPTPGAAPA